MDNYLIGGSSPEIYKNYFKPEPSSSLIGHAVEKLVSLVRKVSHYVLHFFGETNLSKYEFKQLLDKFHTHDFKHITNENQLQQTEEIFDLFEGYLLGKNLTEQTASKFADVSEKLAEAQIRIRKTPETVAQEILGHEEDHVVLPLEDLIGEVTFLTLQESPKGERKSLIESSSGRGSQEIQSSGRESGETQLVQPETSEKEDASDSSAPSSPTPSFGASDLDGASDVSEDEGDDDFIDLGSERGTPAADVPKAYSPSTLGAISSMAAWPLVATANAFVGAASNAINTFVNQTDDAKYLEWKVKRFEDILGALKNNYLSYFDKQGLDLKRLGEEAKGEGAVEWQKQLRPILELLNSFEPKQSYSKERLNQVRVLYTETFLDNLRTAAKWAKESPKEEGAVHINALCFLMYTSLGLNDQFHGVLETFKTLGGHSPRENGPHSHSLIKETQHIFEAIKNAPTEAKVPKFHSWWNSLVGHFSGLLGYSFDPNRQSNPTHVLFTKNINQNGKTYQVKDIGMGSPTIEIGSGKAEINPEFLGAMRYYEEQGYTHFYINNQNYITTKRVKGNEQPRCAVIHELSDLHPNTFFAMTFSQNSRFYKEGISPEEKRLGVENLGAFKRALITEMFDGDPEKTGNNISKNILTRFETETGETLKDWSKKMVEEIHKTAFGGKEALTPQERRIFHRLYYRYLAAKILAVLKPYSYNESCKDRIDRGAASDAEEYARLAISNDQENHPMVVKFFQMMMFVRAIIVRKREIIEERLERALETIGFMLDHKPEVKALNEKLLPGVKIDFDPNKLFSNEENAAIG